MHLSEIYNYTPYMSLRLPNPPLRAPETDFDRGIRHFGYLLTRVMFALVVFTFAVNGIWTFSRSRRV